MKFFLTLEPDLDTEKPGRQILPGICLADYVSKCGSEKE